jgi:hypothetical protein
MAPTTTASRFVVGTRVVKLRGEDDRNHARLSRKSVERPDTLSGGRRATDSRLYRAVIPVKATSAGRRT